MTVLIVAPTRREAAACGPDAFVCGAGPEAGRIVAERLSRGDVSLLVLAGVCGGLDPSLAPGDVILCRRAVAPDKSELLPDPATFDAVRRRLRRQGLGFISSALLSGNRPAGSVRLKTALWNKYGAAGVDMETYAVAETAAARGVPWLVVRSVLDPASAALPRAVLRWRGEADERELVRRLALQPLDWPAYAWRWACGAPCAAWLRPSDPS